MPEAGIDTTDIPEVLDWSDAVRGGLYRARKQAITIRVDADVLAWFRGQADGGRGYQSEINRVLRQHVATQRSDNKRIVKTPGLTSTTAPATAPPD